MCWSKDKNKWDFAGKIILGWMLDNTELDTDYLQCCRICFLENCKDWLEISFQDGLNI